MRPPETAGAITTPASFSPQRDSLLGTGFVSLTQIRAYSGTSAFRASATTANCFFAASSRRLRI